MWFCSNTATRKADLYDQHAVRASSANTERHTFRDYTKAFDKVQHEGLFELLGKLNLLVGRGWILK